MSIKIKSPENIGSPCKINNKKYYYRFELISEPPLSKDIEMLIFLSGDESDQEITTVVSASICIKSTNNALAKITFSFKSCHYTFATAKTEITQLVMAEALESFSLMYKQISKDFRTLDDMLPLSKLALVSLMRGVREMKKGELKKENST